jgi:hypothetical protein
MNKEIFQNQGNESLETETHLEIKIEIKNNFN